jgi:hypothetical protein
MDGYRLTAVLMRFRVVRGTARLSRQQLAGRSLLTIELRDQEPLQQSGVPDAGGEIVDAQSA